MSHGRDTTSKVSLGVGFFFSFYNWYPILFNKIKLLLQFYTRYFTPAGRQHTKVQKGSKEINPSAVQKVRFLLSGTFTCLLAY